MTGTAATAVDRTVAEDAEVVADATNLAGKTWPTDAEFLAAAQLDRHECGRRYQRNVGEHVQAIGAGLRKWAAMGGDGTTSTRQLARDLYPDVGEDFNAARNKRESIRRWLKLLERQGLISMEELRSPGGKALGLRITLLPVPERVARLAASRGCSSAG